MVQGMMICSSSAEGATRHEDMDMGFLCTYLLSNNGRLCEICQRLHACKTGTWLRQRAAILLWGRKVLGFCNLGESKFWVLNCFNHRFLHDEVYVSEFGGWRVITFFPSKQKLRILLNAYQLIILYHELYALNFRWMDRCLSQNAEISILIVSGFILYRGNSIRHPCGFMLHIKNPHVDGAP